VGGVGDRGGSSAAREPEYCVCTEHISVQVARVVYEWSRAGEAGRRYLPSVQLAGERGTDEAAGSDDGRPGTGSSHHMLPSGDPVTVVVACATDPIYGVMV